MHRWSVTLTMVFAVGIISLLSAPDDVHAAAVNINIPPGSSASNCASNPDACYAPDFITVDQFDTITWTNQDGLEHTATSGV